MSKPVNQQQLIKKYFNLLVKEFITDPRHNKDISIVFTDYLESSKENSTTLGHTERSGGGSYTTWQKWTNGVKVPGSERTTYFPYKYVITFLNNYESENDLRGTVVHEFTHLYLYATVDEKHEHDDRFYSAMERFENWLNQNQGLSPRTDKSHDRDQHVDSGSIDTSDKENVCPECSHSSPQHSPQCSHNPNKHRPTKQPKPGQKPDITNDPKKTAELNRLKKLIQTSRDLSTLETTYQNIKVNPLYQGENRDDNKKELDDLYQLQKELLRSQQNLTNNPNSLNKGKWGSGEYLLIILLVTGGIILLIIVGYLVLSSEKKQTAAKKS